MPSLKPDLFKKLNPYIYEDKHKILDKMEKVCCDKDCHNLVMSYHIKNPHVLILSIFHKGSIMYNIRYNYPKKTITYKARRECGCDCLDREIVTFIKKNHKKIRYWFRKEIKPINTALDENKVWTDKKKILSTYLYPDLVNVVSDYLCFFVKCADCGKQISGQYNRCYDCYTKKC